MTGDLVGYLTGDLAGDLVGDLTGDSCIILPGDFVGELFGDFVGDFNLAGDLTGEETTYSGVDFVLVCDVLAVLFFTSTPCFFSFVFVDLAGLGFGSVFNDEFLAFDFFSSGSYFVGRTSVSDLFKSSSFSLLFFLTWVKYLLRSIFKYSK